MVILITGASHTGKTALAQRIGALFSMNDGIDGMSFSFNTELKVKKN